MRFSLLILLLPLYLSAMPGYHEPWGKDTDVHLPSLQQSAPSKPSPLAWFMLQMIRLRQEILTKADGPRSHFRPSSSEYMRLAIHKHGFLKGYIMGCDRLLRENEEKWIYPAIEEDGKVFKYDPPR